MLDETLNNFIAHTAKSKVAVIVPLYGYWKDLENNPLNLQTLQLSLDRITSSIHNVYIFLVAEKNRVPEDIRNYIIVHSQANGNYAGVQVNDGASYTDYVRKGLEVAQDNDFGAAYFIVLNPWNLIQKIGIDAMVDRLNFGDEAKVISGWDLRPEVSSENFDPKVFENTRYNIPEERHKVDMNFLGITRYALEMIPLDYNIKTAYFLECDIWQQLFAKGFTAVASQRLPMFVFDVNIENIENTSDLEEDKKYFVKKWGFIPEKNG